MPITNRFGSNIDEFASQRSMYYDRKAVVDRNIRRVRDAFGAAPERIAGFVYIGTPAQPLDELGAVHLGGDADALRDRQLPVGPGRLGGVNAPPGR